MCLTLLPRLYIGLTRHLAAAGLPLSSPPAINYWNNPLDLSGTGLALGVASGVTTDKQGGSEASGTGSTSGDVVINGAPAAAATGGGGGGGETRLLPPEQFYALTIPLQQPQQPSQGGGEAGGEPLQMPFTLPLEYATALKERSAGR